MFLSESTQTASEEQIKRLKRTLGIGTVVGAIVIVALVIFFINSGSKLKAELAVANNQVGAMTRAAVQYQEFLTAPTGVKAEEKKKSVVQSLGAVHMTPDVLGIRTSDMTQHVQALYGKDASAAFKKLQDTHRDIKKAEQLVGQYHDLLGKAGKSMSATMERQLALNVARNKKEEGVATERAHGVRPPAKRPLGRLSARRR